MSVSGSFSPPGDDIDSISTPPRPSLRLTVTLPPSKKALKNASKLKGRGKGNGAIDSPAPKTPRPIKLKPLKEVLMKLIVQVKKKDDYAFFLEPVNPELVPGYSDIIKEPMDFKTMTLKVERGRYRSLDEFKYDFMLVINNAKAFNPPGTLYHTEASRLETWGLEHITKALAHVIEYETDWNIDVVADDEPTPVASSSYGLGYGADDMSVNPHIKIEGDDGDERTSGRSPSVVSAIPGSTTGRALKGSRSGKKGIVGVSESIDAEGRLPGSKDGLGAFPPASDLAGLMLSLKLRGKRFRSKKERLRMEKAGPPYLPDGSLDYTSMEDPFSVLQALVPDPETLPQLIPVLPSLTLPDPPANDSQQTPEPSHTIQYADPKDIPAPAPITIPPNALDALFSEPVRQPLIPSGIVNTKKRRHWTINRNVNFRSRPKETEDVQDPLLATARPWKRARNAEAADYGTFAALPAQLACEQGITFNDFTLHLGTHEKLLDRIRRGLLDTSTHHHELRKEEDSNESSASPREEVLDAEEYIRDVVYGGVDGFAYVRSIEEFVGGADADTSWIKGENHDINPSDGSLGVPLTQWVQEEYIDPLTRGMHSILRRIVKDPAETLSSLSSAIDEDMETLRQVTKTEQSIDLSSLVYSPQDLLLADTEWAGATFWSQKVKEQKGSQSNAESLDPSGHATSGAHEDEIRHQTGGNKHAMTLPAQPTSASNPIQHALEVGAEWLLELSTRMRMDESADAALASGIKVSPEDADMRKARLNLLAISTRAPPGIFAAQTSS